jgi:hypothetical protein
MTGQGNIKCIYCKCEITEGNKSNEHVFPQSFGCPDTWTMDCVCRGCNINFGQSIERYLARDSLEGLWALKKIGSRSGKPIRQMRVKLNVPDEEKYGEFRGAIVYADFSKKGGLFLPSQILLKDDQGNRKFYLLEEIGDERAKKELSKYKDKTKGFWVFAHDDKEEKIAFEKLNEHGIKFDPKIREGFPSRAMENDGTLRVKIEGLIDDVIYRAIAKMAFNYLAKVKGADFSLASRFDAIREYIRNGIRPEYKIVTIMEGRILAEEPRGMYSFEGHIFTIQTKRNRVIGKISLTNTFGFYYLVDLGDLGPVWYDLKIGHAYSFKEDCILELISPSFIITPKIF